MVWLQYWFPSGPFLPILAASVPKTLMTQMQLIIDWFFAFLKSHQKRKKKDIFI